MTRARGGLLGLKRRLRAGTAASSATIQLPVRRASSSAITTASIFKTFHLAFLEPSPVKVRLSSSGNRRACVSCSQLCELSITCRYLALTKTLVARLSQGLQQTC